MRAAEQPYITAINLGNLCAWSKTVIAVLKRWADVLHSIQTVFA